MRVHQSVFHLAKMISYKNQLFLIAAILVDVVVCAPTDVVISNEIPNRNGAYNFEQYDEVYDQRQNGSENYKVNVNGVVLVWTPPGALLQAATLLDPTLFEGEYPDLEELLSPQNPNKPEDLILVKPEKPSGVENGGSVSASTSKPAEGSTSGAIPSIENLQIQQESNRRKFRLPGFMKPFVNKKDN